MRESVRPKYISWNRIRRAYDEMSDSLGSSLEYYENTVERLGKITGRLLDVGCGQGELLSIIKTNHPHLECCATDVSLACAKSVEEFAQAAIAPAEALPFADATFDFITMSLVIEHCQDDGRALAEVHRCLKPGGRFFVSTDNRLWLQIMALCNRFRPEKKRYKRLEQVVEGDYTHTEFRGLLARAGFTAIRCEPSGPYPCLAGIFSRVPGLRVHLTKRLWYICHRAYQGES